MSLEAMKAVYASRLGPPPLRALALALAWFADDRGRDVWPSVATLRQMVGCGERQIRAGLATLRRRGVLVVESGLVSQADGTMRPAGGRRQSTRYRIDLELLAQLPAVETSARRVRRGGKPCDRLQGFPEQSANASEGKTLQSATENPAICDTKPCDRRPETLRSIADDPYGSVSDPSGTDLPPLPRRGSLAKEDPTDAGAQETRFWQLERAVVAVLNQHEDAYGSVDGSALKEDVKTQCARDGLQYTPLGVDSAIVSVQFKLAKNLGDWPPKVRAGAKAWAREAWARSFGAGGDKSRRNGTAAPMLAAGGIR